MTSIESVIKLAAIPAVSVVIGGAIASVRVPGPAVRSAVQHLAAGVLFAALATELLPDVMHRAMPWMTLLGFALGVACMLGLKALATKVASKAEGVEQEPALPVSLLLISGIDVLVDGLLIGISFAAGAKQGLLVTIALTLEVVFLGIATAAAITGPKARTRIMDAVLVFGLLLLAGAGAGAFLLQGVGDATLDVVMSFGMAALLYLVTEELLTEAHEVTETPLLTSMFFVGFVALLLIEMFM